MSAIHSYDEITKRISAMQKTAGGDGGNPAGGQSIHGVSNPSVPSHPDGDNKKKQQLPPDGENKENASQGVPSGALSGAGPTGTDTPSTTTEPAISDNIDAKTAAAARNAAEIAKRANALTQPKTAAAGAPSTPTAPTTPAPAAPSTPAAAAVVPKTAAVDSGINFDNNFHMKLASAILEVEGGAEMAETFLARFKGREEAHALIKEATAAHQELLAHQREAYEAHEMEKSAEYQEMLMVKQAFDAMTPAEQALTIKIANAHDAAQRMHKVENFALKMAYAQGADDAQMMMDSQGGDPAAEASLPGSEDPSGAGATPEEIAQALMLLVQSGEIDQATAEQVLASIGGGDPAMAGGDPAAAGGGDPMAGALPEEAAGAEVAKAAAALIK